ncbi:nuclear pore complex protein NUP1-like isoform X2 [Juglans microcarpa x Juglans regia]|uniref:nuclear pore complex protein NUP1-like isoform X2 n=1 Tax=Juglans microcarpa x Juglans regia TaxID=2249226 RepID=UPI001B7F4B4A|nr:nuclear pore complex protein NUP1-like isoform X2 [Juglans microcarpa x Juglans regia]
METARQGNHYDVVSEEGLGTGGKFRKRPFRRSTHTTPYDRPATALRNPIISVDANNSRNGWLSRLVDPAQRLITSSAQRLFSSVFRKRLLQPPPPTPPPSISEAKHEVRDKHRESRDQHNDGVVTDSSGVQHGVIDRGDKSTSSDRGGLIELEKILKQKTFTRSEIDHLSALLHSKTVDIHIGDKEKKAEVIPRELVVPHDRKEKFPIAQALGNSIGEHLISAPVSSSRVLDEGVASPAELAKAYMGSRPTNVSPSMLGIRSQAFGEDSTIISSRPFPPKSPVMSLVPRSSGNVGYTENGFTTPRSRGRSAIYSMARTPYSRVHPASSLKGVGPIVSYDGPSLSSTAAWEQDKLHGSGQGALKRRSSVLDNDVGSVGPIRRIRHKPSLLSSRGLSLPVPDSPLSIPGNGVGLGAAQHPSSLNQTQLLLGKYKENSAKASIVNGDNSVPSTSFPPVPSKSSEMASKILQQLEKLASPKEKSSEFKVVSLRDSTPTKLSPSMLRGRALRSLETVESPRFLENVQDDIIDTSLPDALGSTSQKQNKAENGPLKLVAPLEKSVPVVKGIDYRSSNKDTLPGVKTVDSVVDSVTHPPQKKRAFQMSAHEDYLELDDDYPDGAAPTPLVEEREKGDASVAERKTHYTEAVTMEKPPSLLGFKSPASSSLNQNYDLASSVGPVVAEKGTGFAFPSATFTSMAAQPAVPVTESTFTSDKSAPPEQLKVAPPMFGLGGKAALPQEPNATPPVASFASVSSADKVPQFVFASSFSASESAGLKFSVRPDAKLESSSSFPTVDATDSVPKVPDMDKVDNKNYSNAGVTSSIAETALSSAASSPTPTASVGANTSANTSILNNGSSSTTTTTTTAFTAINSRSTLSTSSVAAPSFSTAPIFKSGSIVPSTSAALVTAAFGIESEAAKTRPERSFGNLNSSPFIGTSAANASAGSSIFAFNATDTSTANNKPSSTVFGTGSGSVLSAQASPAGTGAASFQFSSSVPSTSFGLAGNTAFSSGSSLFAASTPASELSNSGTSFGVNSSASSSEANSSSAIAGTTSSLFSSSWQPTKSSIFSSAFNSKSASAGSTFTASTAPVAATTSAITGFSFPASTASVPTTASPPTGFSFMASTASVAASSPSTGFPFTASTAAAAAASTSSSTGFAFASSTAFAASTPAAVTSSASVVFGSNTGSSSGPTFSFTSAMATPSSQPVFGNPSPGFLFNSVSSGTNDQMNMEDSMAEDTVQASTPTAPIFGHPPVSPPQSGFVFGSATPSAANPFQFGGQQSSATPQNLSPFQATNSLGGSFSVGAGGGDKSGRKIVRVSRNKTRKK